MYRLKYLLLISLLALPLMAQQPKESHVKETPSKMRWVPFDLVTNMGIWRDDGRREFPCYIMDWNIMTNPHPTLTIMIPPPNIHTPIRLSFVLTWEETRPSYWMGINGVSKYKCKLKVKDKKAHVRLLVYE